MLFSTHIQTPYIVYHLRAENKSVFCKNLLFLLIREKILKPIPYYCIIFLHIFAPFSRLQTFSEQAFRGGKNILFTEGPVLRFMASFRYILFDFDGTLVDSSEGIYKSLIYAFEAYGHPIPEDKTLKEFIGPPLYHSFTKLFGFSDGHANEMIEKYRERYKVTGYLENTVYPGIPETLRKLKKQGCVLATASSKPLKFVHDICKQRGILDYFDFLGGTTFAGSNDTKASVILNAMDKIGADPKTTLMIGDRRFDIEGAHEAGIPCGAVLFGFGNRDEFEEYKAEYIIEKAEDILTIAKGGI